jgi:hypothetical protein
MSVDIFITFKIARCRIGSAGIMDDQQPPPQLEGKQVHKKDTGELTESQITIASRQKYELLVLVLPR